MSSSGRGRGGGRGAYYKNKYGRGGGQRDGANKRSKPATGGGNYETLLSVIKKIDGRPYPAYHDLETPLESGWNHPQFDLYIGRAQSDPFAAPTRCRAVITNSGIPAALYSNPVRRMAAADFLLRVLYQACQDMGASQALRKGGGWSGPKGGDVQVMKPNQHVLEQSAVRVDEKGCITAQITVNLPARGRTILGQAAYQILDDVLPNLMHSIQYTSLNAKDLQLHVESVEDQVWLQNELQKHSLVAFVPNDAVLPRVSGVDDRPMQGDQLVRFKSPSTMESSFTLPNSQIEIKGLGIPQGITLICGGGFHGKSTLLQALQVGVYPKIPGDGREFCVMSPSAAKIRAEDGRQVQSVDISPFINNLPFGKDTTSFSTMDASGSTSQATNIVEAIELGADTLLIDEDSCASNFMMRDQKMMSLVARDKEPITPFVLTVRSLYESHGVSSVLVIGGVGDYFDVADHVLLMDCYECSDATARALEISKNSPDSSTIENQAVLHFKDHKRMVNPLKYSPDGKVRVNSIGSISYGETNLDIGMVEQLVSDSQTRGIASALEALSKNTSPKALRESLQHLMARVDQNGLDAWTPTGQYNGGLARPRLLELGAAVNRLRRDDGITQQK